MVIAKAPKCTELVSWLDSEHLRVNDSSPVCTLVIDNAHLRCSWT